MFGRNLADVAKRANINKAENLAHSTDTCFCHDEKRRYWRRQDINISPRCSADLNIHSLFFCRQISVAAAVMCGVTQKSKLLNAVGWGEGKAKRGKETFMRH